MHAHSSHPDCDIEIGKFTGNDTQEDLKANYLACQSLITYNGTRHIESDYNAWFNIARPTLDKINDELCFVNIDKSIVSVDHVLQTTHPDYGYSGWGWVAISGLYLGIQQTCNETVCW